MQDAAAAAAKKIALSRGWNAENLAFRAIKEAPPTIPLHSYEGCIAAPTKGAHDEVVGQGHGGRSPSTCSQKRKKLWLAKNGQSREAKGAQGCAPLCRCLPCRRGRSGESPCPGLFSGPESSLSPLVVLCIFHAPKETPRMGGTSHFLPS